MLVVLHNRPSQVLPLNTNENEYQQVPIVTATHVESSSDPSIQTQAVMAQPVHHYSDYSNNRQNPFALSTIASPHALPVGSTHVYAQPIDAPIQSNPGYQPSHYPYTSGNFIRVSFSDLPLFLRVLLGITGGFCSVCLCVIILALIISAFGASLSQKQYLQTIVYRDASCQQSLYLISYPINNCLSIYNIPSSSQNKSLELRYVSNTIQTTYYSDTRCASPATATKISNIGQCSALDSSSAGLYAGSFVSSKSFTGLDGAAIVNSGYSDFDCSIRTMEMAIVLNTCIPLSSSSSVMYTSAGRTLLRKILYTTNNQCIEDGNVLSLYGSKSCTRVNYPRTVAPFRNFAIADDAS